MKKTSKKDPGEVKDKNANIKNETDGQEQDKITENDDAKGYNEQRADSKEEESKDTDEKTALLYKISDINDKYLRVYSDFDNYRKRTIKEKNELGKYANAELITELLPVIDDFERALKLTQKNTETAPIIEGIELIYNKLIKTLELQGLKPIISIGEAFNTDFHEAITKIPVENKEQKGTVFDEVQKGYLLNEKVIRYSKVIVAE